MAYDETRQVSLHQQNLQVIEARLAQSNQDLATSLDTQARKA